MCRWFLLDAEEYRKLIFSFHWHVWPCKNSWFSFEEGIEGGKVVCLTPVLRCVNLSIHVAAQTTQRCPLVECVTHCHTVTVTQCNKRTMSLTKSEYYRHLCIIWNHRPFLLPAPRTRRRKSFDNTSFYLNTDTRKGIVTHHKDSDREKAFLGIE